MIRPHPSQFRLKIWQASVTDSRTLFLIEGKIERTWCAVPATSERDRTMTTEPSQRRPENQSQAADDAVSSRTPLRESDPPGLPGEDPWRKPLRGGAPGAARPRSSFRFRG